MCTAAAYALRILTLTVMISRSPLSICFCFSSPYDLCASFSFPSCCQLDSPYPYPPDSMLFMDFRDLPPPLSPDEEDPEQWAQLPTFVYAMPMSPTRVFFEVRDERGHTRMVDPPSR